MNNKTNPRTPIRRPSYRSTPSVGTPTRRRNRQKSACISTGLSISRRSAILSPSSNTSAAFQLSYGDPMKAIKHTYAYGGRVALQQEDETFGAIVITTLPRPPFCCHEDLLMMSRQQLMEAVSLLNTRLPLSGQIQVTDTTTAADIRHGIERLVGIVPSAPGAPKAVRSRICASNASAGRLASQHISWTHPSPPTSPLATRRITLRRGMQPNYSPGRRLECLREEDESNTSTIHKHSRKRRRISDVFDDLPPSQNLFDEHRMDVDTVSTPNEPAPSASLPRQSRLKRRRSPDVIPFEGTCIGTDIVLSPLVEPHLLPRTLFSRTPSQEHQASGRPFDESPRSQWATELTQMDIF